jgi:hypothetical protein
VIERIQKTWRGYRNPGEDTENPERIQKTLRGYRKP